MLGLLSQLQSEFLWVRSVLSSHLHMLLYGGWKEEKNKTEGWRKLWSSLPTELT